MDKIMVIGAAGFVAKNLLPYLASSPQRTLILVDKKFVPKTVIMPIIGKVKIQQYVTNRIPIEKSLDRVNTVICVAGATSVDAALEFPASAIEDNLSIALNLAEYARCRNPNARLIYMSSDEVLGDSQQAKSEDDPLDPTQPYAASKAACELILHNYRDIYGLNLITLRSCNLVGSGQKEPKLLPVAVRCLLRNEPIPIHGTGEQLREWMSVDDLCRAILILMNSSTLSKGVYQATTGIKFSVNEVVKIISDALNSRLMVKNVKDRLIQDHCYSMKSDKLRSIGWYPSVEPKQAIKLAAISLADEYLLPKLYS